MDILLWVILGAVAGWIAGLITKNNHGVVEDIILGIIGAFLGGFILNQVGVTGITGFNFYSLLVAVFGAVVLILIGRLLHK